MKTRLKFLAITAIATIISSCTSDLQEVKLIPVKSGEEFQYIDKEGKIVINPQFSEASVFRNGLALVKPSGTDAKWGFIDEKGAYVINPQYKYATVFNEGLAWVVTENGAPTAINDKGEIKITLQNAEEVRVFSNGLAAYSVVDKDGKTKWGFVDTNGDVKINPQFTNVGNFSFDLCAVVNDKGKWGYIDKSGKLSINYQFDQAQNFSFGRAVVLTNEKYGVIGVDGKYLINPQFKNMAADGDWFAIYQNDKWGWCDKDGKIIINPQFASVGIFGANELAPVQSGENWGYVNKEGKIIINPQFSGALSFNKNLALVASSDKIGFINKEGKFVVNPQFNDVSRDYILFVGGGGTMYGSVESDYFNVEVVTSAIDLHNTEGISLNSTFGDVKKTFNLQEDDFGHVRSMNLVYEKKLTKDIYVKFYVIGEAFETVYETQGSGWYTYNSPVEKFASSTKIEEISYWITLTGKGIGKSKAIITSLVNRLEGYSRGKDSNTNMYFSKFKKNKITLFGADNSIIITILPLDGTEVIDMNTEIYIYGEDEAPATDSVAVDTVSVVDTSEVGDY